VEIQTVKSGVGYVKVVKINRSLGKETHVLLGRIRFTPIMEENAPAAKSLHCCF